MAPGRSNLDFPVSSILFNHLKLKLMEKEQHTHIVKYKTYVFVLIALLFMTFTSVAVTHINLGPYTVTTALVLASFKSLLVLLIFMHLKFDKKFFGIMVGSVFLLFACVVIITFLDYLYR